MSNEKLLLIKDEQTKYDIEHLPEGCKDISDFQIVTKENISDEKLKLKDYFVRDSIGGSEVNTTTIRAKKLEEFFNENIDKNYTLILSPVCENIYYPAEDFQKYFEQDSAVIYHLILIKMGAKIANFKYVTEIEGKEEKKLDAEVKGDAKHQTDEEEMKVETETGWNWFKKMEKLFKREKITQSKRFNTKRLSREELKKWIKTNKINTDLFPEFLLILYNRYLEEGKIEGIEKGIENIQNNSTIQEKIEFGWKIQAIIKGLPCNVGINFKYNEEKIEEIFHSISYEIHF